MKPNWWPGEEHELFREWAISQGIVVNGVGPARFAGRGLGMIAMRSIEKDEAIVRVPKRAMLTLESVPISFTSRFPEGTRVHVILAAYLTNGDPADLKKYDSWKRTWPTREDFEEVMPLLWPEFLRGSKECKSLLPPSISSRWNSFQKRKLPHAYETSHQNLLPRQEKRLRAAWESVLAVFPETNWEAFSYHWLIVNTRSFFYLMPGKEPPEDRNDAMALLPFADYFNHSDMACNVKFDGQEYVFRATKHYEEGEEIYMSYGTHTNDFLFTEYGFYLDQNDFEAIYLDDVIFQDLKSPLLDELNLQKYYGNYQLTATGVCFRTEIAACIKYMPLKDWEDYVLGYSTEGVDAKKSEAVIREWIQSYLEEADMAIVLLENLRPGQTDRKHQEKVQKLLNRWKQIEDSCHNALEKVSF